MVLVTGYRHCAFFQSTAVHPKLIDSIQREPT
jgi:hypothetical protein